ncbi:MAG TPA: tRNA (adenosine(37)-N6)-threonylcarbamoyltransferase complex dimerization subunit type 1 TsaB [Bacteroidota bacterium]
MTVLGLETSSRICSVGLADDHGPSAVLSLDAGSVHSEKLLTMINSLLDEHSATLRSVDAIAVSSGPGSFTGLRIGFSAAKGLCLSLGKPLAVVSTFEALARRVARGRNRKGNIVVALDAKKGDFYAGMFQQTGEDLKPNGETLLLHTEDLPAWLGSLPEPLMITDSQRELRSILGDARVEIEEAGPYFRGDEIAALGLHAVRNGRLADIAQAEPLYLKDFVVARRPPAV